MQKLISIITPVYNQEKFIVATIKSVLSQTYQNWEMLIVDDYSTDKSWEIIQKWSKKDSRIKIFRNEINKGLIENWKFLIDNSKGEYIAFLEGDDVFYENNLSKKLNIFTKYPLVNMVYCNLNMINAKGDVTLRNYYKKNKIKAYKNQKIKPEEYLLSKIAPFSTYSQIMIRMSIVEDGFVPRSLDFDAKIFLPSDWDYNFMVSTKNNVYFIDDTLLGHRKHDSNNSADMLKAAKHYNLLFADYENEYKNDKKVSSGILYQRGKIKYFIALYYLEQNNKLSAWKEFIGYVIYYPRNILYDIKCNLKMLVRLFLPKRINTMIVNKYHGR